MSSQGICAATGVIYVGLQGVLCHTLSISTTLPSCVHLQGIAVQLDCPWYSNNDEYLVGWGAEFCMHNRGAIAQPSVLVTPT